MTSRASTSTPSSPNTALRDRLRSVDRMAFTPTVQHQETDDQVVASMLDKYRGLLKALSSPLPLHALFVLLLTGWLLNSRDSDFSIFFSQARV